MESFALEVFVPTSIWAKFEMIMTLDSSKSRLAFFNLDSSGFSISKVEPIRWRTTKISEASSLSFLSKYFSLFDTILSQEFIGPWKLSELNGLLFKFI